MRSDNLVPLLAPQKPTGMGARKGVVVSWDQETAENTVLVGGTLLTNLPILNTSEAAILAEGDIVTCITLDTSWAILGRLTIPATPEAVSALSSLRTESATVSGVDTISSTSYIDAPTNPGPEVSITVGPSGRLLVFLGAHILSQGPVTAAGNSQTVQGGMGFRLSGANTSAVVAGRVITLEAGLLVNSGTSQIRIEGDAGRAILVAGLNPGLTAITGQYRSTSGVTTQFSDRNITVMAL